MNTTTPSTTSTLHAAQEKAAWEVALTAAEAAKAVNAEAVELWRAALTAAEAAKP